MIQYVVLALLGLILSVSVLILATLDRLVKHTDFICGILYGVYVADDESKDENNSK